MYKYDKKLEEEIVAALYATGFVSAAVSAAFIGQLADKYGRKKACMVYCGTYAACCLSMLSDNLYVLFAGKLCGGVSTTLLYSVFDAWMITEYHQRGMEAKGLSLGTLYGWLTSLNSVVAISTGIVGEILVGYTGSKVSPFMLAASVFAATALWINSAWVSAMFPAITSYIFGQMLSKRRQRISEASQWINRRALSSAPRKLRSKKCGKVCRPAAQRRKKVSC